MANQPPCKLGGIYCSHIEVFSHQVAAGTERGAAATDCVELTELRMKMSMLVSQPAGTRRSLQQQAVYMQAQGLVCLVSAGLHFQPVAL